MSLAPSRASTPKSKSGGARVGAGRPKVLDIDWNDPAAMRTYKREYARKHKRTREAYNEYMRVYMLNRRVKQRAERQRVETLQLACI